jgi:hypothetical protein
MKRGYIFILAAAGIFVCFSTVRGDEAAQKPPEVQAALKSLALFKNGLGYFVWEVQLPPNAASFRFKPPAAPTHGTCWVSGPAGVKIKGLMTVEAESPKTIDAMNVFELIKANVGRRVKIDTGKEIIEGKILRVPEDRLPENPEPYYNNPRFGPYYNPGIINSQLVIIQTANSEIGIASGQIQRVEFPETPAVTSFTRQDKTLQLEVQLEQPTGGQTLMVSCLAKGATWAPSYRVDISKPDQARLSASAVIINETTDFDNTTVELVTGFPNLRFADIISPLAKKAGLAEFLRALASGRSEQDQYANSPVSQQRADYSRGGMGGGSWSMPQGEESINYGTAATGAEAEDLFLYPLEKVSLKKNQTGYFPLFTETVPYTHIYQWNIPDYVNENDQYQYQHNRRQREATEEKPEIIWHSLKLQNKTAVPWTTAPAETVRDGMILGQDMLNYTAAGAESTLKITQAVNVKAEQGEYEIERKRDALHMYGNSYDLIKLEGKLTVMNLQDKPIDLEIVKTLSGEIKSIEGEPRIDKPGKGLHRMNGLVKATWTKTLPDREKIEIAYVYEVYVQR